MQLRQPNKEVPKVVNVGGGKESSLSLLELSQYCSDRFSVNRKILSQPTTRPFDVPYYVTDNSSVRKAWNWKPGKRPTEILDSITDWAIANRRFIETGFSNV
jgi:CDP-paratose 2-epimerase